MLRAGVSEEAIANAFTKQLNEAIEATRKPTPYQEACMKLAEAWNEALDTCDVEAPDSLYLESADLEEIIRNVIQNVIAIEKIATRVKEEPMFKDLVDALLQQ